MNATQFSEIQKIIDKANKSISKVSTTVGVRVYFLGTEDFDTALDLNAYQCMVNYIYQKYNILRNDGSQKTENREFRDILYYILKKDFKLTYKFIGSLFGKDHSTIIHNVNKTEGYLDINNQDYKSMLEDMRKFLRETN